MMGIILENTSDNAIIRSFIDFAGNSITAKMETLLAGGYIIERIEENLAYDYLHASEDNLWSILYLTGYLTKVRDQDIKTTLPDGMTALLIPNAEIREIFEAKYSKTFQQLERDCNKAIHQIERRMYAREFEENGDDVFCYGISFFKKRCFVKLKS